MNSSIDARLTTGRLHAIDWARGLAVLIMILAHVIDAWTRSEDRITLTYRYLKLLGGFAAPLFLWLSGVSLALAGEATRHRTGSVAAARRRLVSHGLELFILAFAFRVHAFVFNPGGSLLTLFRVDILNVLGISLTLAGALWGTTTSLRRRLLLFGVAATSVAMLTPVLPDSPWIDRLPIWLQWHLRPAGEHTVFTLFPWMGFVFAGAAFGAVLGRTRSTSGAGGPSLVLVGGATVVLLLGLRAGTLPTPFGAVAYWTTSPAFFAVRVGIIALALCALLAAQRRFDDSRPGVLRVLRRFGEGSLLVYWIHVQLVYGWATEPLHRTLSISQALLAYILFSSLMFGLIPLRDRLQAGWTLRRRAQVEPETTSALVV